MEKKNLQFMNFKEWLFVIGVVLIIVAGILVINFWSTPTENGFLTGGVIPGSILAYETSSSGEVIHTGALFLHRVIVGIDTTDALISIIDATTSLGKEVFFQLEGDTLQGSYEIGANLTTGMWVTVSGVDNATFIYTPTE